MINIITVNQYIRGNVNKSRFKCDKLPVYTDHVYSVECVTMVISLPGMNGQVRTRESERVKPISNTSPLITCLYSLNSTLGQVTMGTRTPGCNTLVIE